MAMVELIPMLGRISDVRSETLRGCHALTDHSRSSAFKPGELGVTVEKLSKQLLAHDDYLRTRIAAGEEVLLIMHVRL